MIYLDKVSYNRAGFSAGGVLVDEDKQQVLLIYKETTSEWLLPKGHMEESETIEETAQRVFEETGYKNIVGKLLSVQIRLDVVDQTNSKVIFWFYCFLVDKNKYERTQVKNESFTGK